MTSYAEFFMNKAIEIALEESSLEEVPIGCILVKNEVIIASSGNTTKKTSHVVSHAEINVIKKASILLQDWRLSDCDLFVTMEPCLMCMGAIILSRIRTVYYGVNNLQTGAFHGETPIDDKKLKTMIISGINEPKNKEIIQNFFKLQRSKKDEKI
jgi:tRNA(adenine34) deaminase